MTRTAWGHGLLTTTDGGAVLDAWYPAPALGSPDGSAAPDALEALVGTDEARGVTRRVATVEVDLDAVPASAEDAYLRLHLLSHRVVLPNSINLDGIFGVLPNVVWTTQGPCAVDGFELTRARLQARGPVQVLGVDKFPRMVDYVVPSGVRIADADRVRLGAHLASGTTVMHEGFVNYNAGTLGLEHGRGPDQPGRRRRRRLGHRRRGQHDGHPVAAAARNASASASVACSEPSRAWASPSVTTASSRPASTSPPGPRSPSPTGRWPRRASSRDRATCSSCATRSPAPSRPVPATATASC